ncbi:MAG: rubredoxin-like domain-containing protein [Halobacteriaceae archaeon]
MAGESEHGYMTEEDDGPDVGVGATVYDGEGNALGTVRGFDEDGFFVTIREGVASMSIEHERSGHEFGEAELMWRCSDCGALGDLEELPDECPNCGAPAEHIYWWTED